MSDKKVNKVVYDGETLIDLTSDSVTPETLAKGETAHDASGEQITGVLEATGGQSLYEAAVEAGYTGTEAEFYAALATLKDAPFLPLNGGVVTHHFEVESGAENPTKYLVIDTSAGGLFRIGHTLEITEPVKIKESDLVVDESIKCENIFVAEGVDLGGGLEVGKGATIRGGLIVEPDAEHVGTEIDLKGKLLCRGVMPNTLPGEAPLGTAKNRFNTLFTKKVDASEHVITPKIKTPGGVLKFQYMGDIAQSPDPLPVEWGGTGKTSGPAALSAFMEQCHVNVDYSELYNTIDESVSVRLPIEVISDDDRTVEKVPISALGTVLGFYNDFAYVHFFDYIGTGQTTKDIVVLHPDGVKVDGIKIIGHRPYPAGKTLGGHYDDDGHECDIFFLNDGRNLCPYMGVEYQPTITWSNTGRNTTTLRLTNDPRDSSSEHVFNYASHQYFCVAIGTYHV